MNKLGLTKGSLFRTKKKKMYVREKQLEATNQALVRGSYKGCTSMPGKIRKTPSSVAIYLSRMKESICEALHAIGERCMCEPINRNSKCAHRPVRGNNLN